MLGDQMLLTITIVISVVIVLFPLGEEDKRFRRRESVDGLLGRRGPSTTVKAGFARFDALPDGL
jgi:hypothetical protein